MATPVTVSTSRDAEGRVVVSATGELDMSNIDDFSGTLAKALAQSDGEPVRLDFRGIEYLDSGAINALFPHAERVRLIANPVLSAVLKISGLTDVMSVETGG